MIKSLGKTYNALQYNNDWKIDGCIDNTKYSVNVETMKIVFLKIINNKSEGRSFDCIDNSDALEMNVSNMIQ